MDATLLDVIHFKNKKELLVDQKVSYEWRPVLCKNLNNMVIQSKFAGRTYITRIKNKLFTNMRYMGVVMNKYVQCKS